MIAAELARLDGTCLGDDVDGARPTAGRRSRPRTRPPTAPSGRRSRTRPTGDMDAAVAAFGAADAIAQRLGATPLRSWLLRVAREYGIRTGGDARARVASPTIGAGRMVATRCGHTD